MSKIRILLDVDGILADFVTPCVAHVNEIMGTTYTVDDVDRWDIMEALDVPPKVATEVFDRMKEKDACYNLAVYSGAQEAVEGLKAIGEVFAVTAPMSGPNWAHERERWLNLHFGIKPANVISTSAKHCVAGDILIEDKTSTLIKWREHHAHGYGVLWHRPSNRHDAYDGDRAYNWPELLEFCRSWSESHRSIGFPRRWVHF